MKKLSILIAAGLLTSSLYASQATASTELSWCFDTFCNTANNIVGGVQNSTFEPVSFTSNLLPIISPNPITLFGIIDSTLSAQQVTSIAGTLTPVNVGFNPIGAGFNSATVTSNLSPPSVGVLELDLNGMATNMGLTQTTSISGTYTITLNFPTGVGFPLSPDIAISLGNGVFDLGAGTNVPTTNLYNYTLPGNFSNLNALGLIIGAGGVIDLWDQNGELDSHPFQLVSFTFKGNDQGGGEQENLQADKNTYCTDSDCTTLNSTPEPGMIGLLGFSLAGLAVLRRKQG